VLRVDGHSELTREEPEPVGIVRSADHPVIVEVEARGDTRVGRRRVAVGVEDRARPVLADGQVVLLEEAQREASGIEVELVDQQDLRAYPLDDLRHRLRLRVRGRREVGDELALAVSVERGVKGRETDLLASRSGRGDEHERKRGPNTPRGTSGVSAEGLGSSRLLSQLRPAQSHPPTCGWQVRRNERSPSRNQDDTLAHLVPEQ
jgi:hypothetical protein